ncbi:MAG: hypothetical protein A2X12_09460 [Bacteroidetes bacterium GWE2_29_8]|nr:MAG: hypothetical protein A2X12_09460 [Bacteroidetes bacterium GWE2_29_8]
MCKIRSLKKLVIGNNDIKSIPTCIQSLNNLSYLDLSLNFINNLPEEIQQLKKLKLLDLRVNPIKDEEQDKIFKLLPKTKMLISPNCNCQ